MGRMTSEEYAEQRESDNADSISNIEDVLIEVRNMLIDIRNILKEMNKK